MKITSFFPPVDAFERRRVELEREKQRRSETAGRIAAVSTSTTATTTTTTSDRENSHRNSMPSTTNERQDKRLRIREERKPITRNETIVMTFPNVADALALRATFGTHRHTRGLPRSDARSVLNLYGTTQATTRHHLVNAFVAASTPSVMEFDAVGELFACGMGGGRVMVFNYDDYVDSRRAAVNAFHSDYGRDAKRRAAKWRSSVALRNRSTAPLVGDEQQEMLRDASQLSVGAEQPVTPPVLNFTVPSSTAAYPVSSLSWNPQETVQIAVGIMRADTVFVYDLERDAGTRPSRTLTSYNNGSSAQLESRGHTVVRHMDGNRVLGGGIDGMVKVWDMRLATPGAVWRAMEVSTLMSGGGASTRRDVRGLVRSGEHGLFSAHVDGRVYFHDMRVAPVVGKGTKASAPVFDVNVGLSAFYASSASHGSSWSRLNDRSRTARHTLASMTTPRNSSSSSWKSNRHHCEDSGERGPITMQLENGRCLIVNEFTWKIVEELPNIASSSTATSMFSSSTFRSEQELREWEEQQCEKEELLETLPRHLRSQVALDVTGTGLTPPTPAATHAIGYLPLVPGGVIYTSGYEKNKLNFHCTHTVGSSKLSSSSCAPMITLTLPRPIVAIAVHPTNGEVLVGTKGSGGILAAHGLDMKETLETLSEETSLSGMGEREDLMY